jgi:hypothetical protein
MNMGSGGSGKKDLAYTSSIFEWEKIIRAAEDFSGAMFRPYVFCMKQNERFALLPYNSLHREF